MEVSSSSPASSGEISAATEEEEDSCRICRGPTEPENPLRYPCACRGTMKFVHEDCLNLWLNRRKISRCEVCKYKFLYSRIYATSAPSRLSPKEVVAGLAAQFLHLLRILHRFTYLCFIWLLAIPFTTHWIWEFAFSNGFSEAQSIFTSRLTFSAVLADCLRGLLISFGIACASLGITFMRIIFSQQLRGIPGLGNRILNSFENEPGNVGGGQVITHVLGTLKRSLVYLSNWWKVSLTRILVCFGIVEVAQLNELVNLLDPFFPFDDNAFSVVASNLGFIVILVLLPFILGWIVIVLRYLILSSTAARVLLSSVVPMIKNKATNALLYFYGVSTPIQLLDEGSKLLVTEISEIDEASNTAFASGVSGLEHYTEQPSVKPSLSVFDNITTLIGLIYILILLSVTLYTRYTFRIDAVWSRVRRFFALFICVMKIVTTIFMAILKVIVLLLVKVVIFPLVCGLWLDVCTLRMFGQTIAERIELSVNNPLCMTLGHWALGIAYLACFFLHLNCIKQVLRDRVLHFLPKISEADNFFSRMIDCSMFKHAQNILLLLGVHGSLMVLLVYVPIRLIILCVPSVFPLHVSFPRGIFSDDHMYCRNLIQYGFPTILRFYLPSRTFTFFSRKWLSVISSLLGLSDFLLPKHENNNGNVYQLRQLAVAIVEGSVVQTYKPGKIEGGKDDKAKEGIEAAHLFALRIAILLILAWITAIIFNSLMLVVPILVGRTICRLVVHFFTSHKTLKINDLTSFLTGTLTCRSATASARDVVEHIQRRGLRDFLFQIMQWCRTTFRFCALLLLVLFAIPIAIGLLLHLVVAVPIQLPLHTLFVWCGLGWIFLTTLIGLVLVDFMHSVEQRWVAKFQRVLSDGRSHQPTLWTLREIFVPVTMTLVIASSTSYMVARLVLTMLGYPFPVYSVIHRFVWPGFFAFGSMWLCVKIVRLVVVYLHNKVRDDRYCVGQTLQDYGEVVQTNTNEDLK